MLRLRVPGEKAQVLPGGRAEAAVERADQVSAVVARRRDAAERYVAELPAAEARGDDADVNVADGRKLPHEACTTIGAVRRLAQTAIGLAQARWIDQTPDQQRDGELQDRLLVGHRDRVVDHEQQIDLVDARDHELIDPQTRGVRSRRTNRSIEASDCDQRGKKRSSARNGLGHTSAQPTGHGEAPWFCDAKPASQVADEDEGLVCGRRPSAGLADYSIEQAACRA